MLDEILGWLPGLLPFRVWLAMMITFLIMVGCLVVWATW